MDDPCNAAPSNGSGRAAPLTLAWRWATFVARWHRSILLGALLLTLASGLSLLGLRFDFDVLDMLPAGAPAFDNFRSFVADFGELDQLVILLEGNDPAALRRFADVLARRLQALDTVERVQARLDVEAIDRQLFGRFLINYLPVEAYAQLQQRLTPQGIDAQVAIDRAMLQAPLDLSIAPLVRRDPLGLVPLAAQPIGAAFDDTTLNLRGGYLATRDGTALLIFVRPTRNAFDIPFTTRFMEQVHAAEAAGRGVVPDPGIRVAYTGSYAFALEDAATLRRDVARYSVLALVGVLAIFLVGYRNFRILPFVTWSLLMSTLLTFAISLLCYAQLNAVSLSFAAILYGLSIDSGIHYFTRLSQEAQAHDARTAVARTLSGLGGANLVATTTTAAVFWVIGFSQILGIRQLGSLTGIGMLINLAQFFVLYPALSYSIGRPSLTHRSLDTPRLGRIAAACARHAGRTLWGTAALMLPLALAASRVGFDADLTHLRPGRSSAARVQAEIEARFGADRVSGAILVRAPSLEQALRDSERVEARLRAYRDAGTVRGVRGISALLPSAAAQRERLARFAALPRQQILDDLRQALLRHGFQPEQFADFFADFARPHTEIIGLGAAALQPVAPVIARHVRQGEHGFTVATYVQPGEHVGLGVVAERLHSELPDVSFIVAARSLLEEALGQMLHRELIGFFIAAFLLNFGLVFANTRRVGLTTAILLPEALVIVCCLAFMDLSGAGIGPVNLIVVPLVLGIGVDHCVYIAERWQEGGDVGEAVRCGGRGVLVSGLTTTAGFGVLGLSGYPALAGMGMLAAASLGLCLIAAFTLFPALLAWLAPGLPARH
jgi:predicted RND superfamily exporter protein